MTYLHLAREEQLLLCGDATSLLTYQAAVDAVSFHAGRGAAFVHDSDVTPAAGRIAHELDILCHVLGVDLVAPPRDEVHQTSNKRKRKGEGWRIEMDIPYRSGFVCIVVDCNEQSEDVSFTLVSKDGVAGPATVARCSNHGAVNCLDEGSVSLQVISRAARRPPTQCALLLRVTFFHSCHTRTHTPCPPFPPLCPLQL